MITKREFDMLVLLTENKRGCISERYGRAVKNFS